LTNPNDHLLHLHIGLTGAGQGAAGLPTSTAAVTSSGTSDKGSGVTQRGTSPLFYFDVARRPTGNGAKYDDQETPWALTSK
jgi:hypothetical protein